MAVAHKSLFIDDSSSSTSVSRTDNIKLPKLELPTFDGEPLSWPLFWERFSVAIDQNSRLSDEEKLAYLRSAMKSPLAKQIVSPQTGGSHNYSTLLNLLKQTFEDKRKIYCNHLNSLLDATGYKLHYEDIVKLRAVWEQNLTGLEATGIFDVERFCTALAIRNMTPEVHHEWAKYIKGYDGIPPINVFKDFLTEQMRTLRPGAESHLKKPTIQNYSSYRPKPTKASIHLTTGGSTSGSCAVCGESLHLLYFCSVFKSTPAQQKLGLVRKSSACNNCLNFGHKTRDCKSSKRCRHCGSKHHYLLHLNDASKSNTSGTTPNPQTSETAAAASVNSLLVDTSTTTEFTSSLLMTAEVIIRSDHGKRVKIRALLDTGSSASLLTNSAANQLGLRKIRQTTRIMGIQGNPAKPSNYLAVFSAETTCSEKMVKITSCTGG